MANQVRVETFIDRSKKLFTFSISDAGCIGAAAADIVTPVCGSLYRVRQIFPPVCESFYQVHHRCYITVFHFIYKKAFTKFVNLEKNT